MKRNGTLEALLTTVLAVVLVLLVASRAVEKTGETPVPDSDAAVTAAGDAQPDNDLSVVAQTAVTPTPVPTPEPTVFKPDIDITSWQYLLANADHSIGQYSPPSVTEIAGTAQYFDSRAADALERFLQAARDAGFTPYLNTAYRTYKAQNYLFNGKASQLSWDGTYTYEQAVELAKKTVAYPGTSDYQTGLGCAITDQYYQTMDADKMDQELLSWLREHCAEYGFILRFPSDKADITGWNEPWHYRYVGEEAAAYIMENDLTLEEFCTLYE